MSSNKLENGATTELEKKPGLSRRRFLELGAAGAAALTIGSLIKFQPSFLAGGGESLHEGVLKSIRSTCALCVNKCGIEAQVRDGILHKLDPILDHPKSKGMLCAKGNAGVNALYDPNRLKAPLIRKGPRGSGQWRQATWDEALDHVAENLQKVRDKMGPEGVLFSSTEGFQEHFFLSFANAWGSPNIVRHPTLCLASMVNGMFNTFGTVPAFDLANSRYVILAGANRFEALVTPDSVDLMRSLGGQSKLVVLEPRFTITASKADEWLPVRPGTDLAFVLGMLNVIIGEDLYDKDFVEKYTIGFEELREHVVSHTPEWAAEQCDIESSTIRRIAREFAAAAPRAIFYPGRRSSWFKNDTQFRRGIGVLNAVVGAWDRPGACLPKGSIPLGEPDVFPPDDIKIARCDELFENFPLANRKDGTYISMRESVLQAEVSPVQAWMIYKQNPLHSVPDSGRTLRMMDRMDFIVTIDTIPTDTAWNSDVILPESMYLERTDPPHSIAGAIPVLLARQQVVPPRHDTKPNIEIIQGLAERLDLVEYFDYKVEDWIEAAVQHLPIDAEDLLRVGYYTDRDKPVIGSTLNEEYRFRTKSGKIELASERYREKGYPPVPTYKPPEPITAGRYRLLTGRSAIYTHAALQGVPWLAKVDPEGPRVWINPKAAAQHGLRSGDPVRLRSDFGEARCHVVVTEKIRPDCVFVPHGFGSTSAGLNESARQGARGSDIIGTFEDEITGNAAMHETTVEILPDGGKRFEPKTPPTTRHEGRRA